jgi:amino acid permease
MIGGIMMMVTEAVRTGTLLMLLILMPMTLVAKIAPIKWRRGRRRTIIAMMVVVVAAAVMAVGEEALAAGEE